MDMQNTLTLPIGTSMAADGAFAGREDIRRVVLPAGLSAIGNEAFTGCTALGEVHCRPLTPVNIDGCLPAASAAYQTDLQRLLEAKGNERQTDMDFKL